MFKQLPVIDSRVPSRFVAVAATSPECAAATLLDFDQELALAVFYRGKVVADSFGREWIADLIDYEEGHYALVNRATGRYDFVDCVSLAEPFGPCLEPSHYGNGGAAMAREAA